MSSVKDVGNEDFDNEVLAFAKLVSVEFWKEGCHWCEMLQPIYEEVSEKYSDKIKFTRVDIGENSGLIKRFEISATPTTIIFCKGQEVEKLYGYMEKEKVEEILKGVIENNSSCVD